MLERGLNSSLDDEDDDDDVVLDDDDDDAMDIDASSPVKPEPVVRATGLKIAFKVPLP